ncbi:MAG TPA: hypothetical protein IAA20_00790 [Candidatus Enterococcus avicola]|uniref:PIN domain-containing protein n=1 Tax=Candidatus Enterococcus avicola TaxID=2838561 RepID=A0A9D2JGE8_9ENTE|nr:hypothetical protein [Candidatus Enterococcus avicola]
MINKNKTFIDTNILLFMKSFDKYPVDEWLEALYDTIYVHKDIVEELKSEATRNFIQNKISISKIWKLFNPEDEEFLSEEDYHIYEAIYNQNRIYFNEYQKTRKHKATSDLGDIAILSGCQFLKIPLISSHDSDFRAIIGQYDLKINDGLEVDEEELISVDSLFEIGDKLIEKEICRRSEYRKFIKVSLGTSKTGQIDAHFRSDS